MGRIAAFAVLGFGRMSYLSKHFHRVAGSPKPPRLHSLFGRGRTYTSSQPDATTSELLQQLVGVSSIGQVAKTVLKDVFPIGGLISGIVGLFDSAPTPPPLPEYDAAPSLNFSAVLNSDGSLSQGSSNQFGFTRASSPGLDLVDALGGPSSPYDRAADGSLVATAGDPTSRYTGALNLPEMLQPLVQSSPSSGPVSSYLSGPSTATVASPAAASPVVQSSLSESSSGGLNSSSGQFGVDPQSGVPAFDQQWFNDHGNLIASAVRAQMLNYHPIVDTINDL